MRQRQTFFVSLSWHPRFSSLVLFPKWSCFLFTSFCLLFLFQRFMLPCQDSPNPRIFVQHYTFRLSLVKTNSCTCKTLIVFKFSSFLDQFAATADDTRWMKINRQSKDNLHSVANVLDKRNANKSDKSLYRSEKHCEISKLWFLKENDIKWYFQNSKKQRF